MNHKLYRVDERQPHNLRHILQRPLKLIKLKKQ